MGHVVLSCSRPRQLVRYFAILSTIALLAVGLSSLRMDRAQPGTRSDGRWIPTEGSTLPPLDNLLAQTSLPTGFGWSTPAQRHQTEQVKRLWRCTQARAGCSEDQAELNIVLLGANEFRLALEGRTGGETVWASSVLRTMNSLGYTTLLAADLNQTTAIHGLFAPWIKVVIVSGADSFACSASPECIKQFPADDKRIPAWKLFSLHFWGNPKNPLGPRWTLSPEVHLDKAEPNFDLGYSIETTCSLNAITPHSERVNQAYLFAKHSNYFVNDNYAWSDSILDETSSHLGLTFVGAPSSDDVDATSAPPDLNQLPPALHLLSKPGRGILSQAEFNSELGRSVALVGVGDPARSPTPYDGLCRGIPFINPILSHSASDPTNRSLWLTQQPTLQWLDPPYVYNVFRGDQQGFEDALRRARDEPFEGRFIVPRMKESEMRKRVVTLVEGDWESEAETLLDRRRKGEAEGEVFVL